MVKFFGTTIRETIDAFKPVHLGEEQPQQNDKVKAIGRLVVTIFLLILATYMVTNPDMDSKIGSTIIGGIIGYWLK